CGRRIDCGPCPGDLACPECAATEVCRNGECLSCTVTCASNQTSEECGAALSTALGNASLATVTVCPGTYVGNFSISRGVTLVGAGQGTDPAANTILSGNQAGRVLLLMADAASVTLEKLRIAGGMLSNDDGAGIANLGAGLTMTNCTVSDNEGSNVNGVGIYSQSSLQMTGCQVSDNACTDGGEALAGGIYAQGPTTLTDCQITGNQTSGEGGGLLVASGLTSLDGQTTISGNVAAGGGGILVASDASLRVASTCQVTHNTATELYGGIANGGAVTLLGSSPETIVVNNCPDNCFNVPGCTENQVDCPN
ncbi:MAG: right-handed parallel beta-helix repeat-containing protein, partial [Chloroflexota bacterium]|nr:right-handed parallel beta-helix repeat-containing protein [Chloroflexota bacterium]